VVVDGGLREAGGAAEVQEAFFEFGFREGGAGLVVVEGCQQLARSAVAGMGSGEGIEGKVAAEPGVLRSVEQALDAAVVEDGGEVEDRAAGSGDGDAVLRGRPALEAAGAVDPEALRRSRPPEPGTVTSTSVASLARSSHSAPAAAWLRTAPRPHARTAAIHRPRGTRTV
jgi:hypothetical protein